MGLFQIYNMGLFQMYNMGLFQMYNLGLLLVYIQQNISISERPILRLNAMKFE